MTKRRNLNTTNGYLFILLFFSISILSFEITDLKSQPVTQQWAQRFASGNYASGQSVKLDAAGNVYVLMIAEIADSTNGDYCVLKYSNTGILQWTAFYNSPGNLPDQPAGFDVNAGGDAYITGTSRLNNIYYITTVKFNTSGVLQWARVYQGEAGYDEARDIKIDKNGNAIVIGESYTLPNGVRVLAIKYDPSGDTLWVQKFIGMPPHSSGWREAIDDSGNVHIAGQYGTTNYDYLVIKYNTQGVLQWFTTYDSPEHYDDLTWAIAIDSNRNVYVIGTNSVPTALANNTLIKVNDNGSIQWARTFMGIAGINNGCGIPWGIAATLSGSSIYYTTSCDNGSSYDIVTLKYNSFGDSVWVRRYGGGINYTSDNEPAGINLDKYENVYVVGKAFFQATSEDYVLIKYLPSGIQQWVASYNGPLTNSFDYGHDLVVDTMLNVFVTGISSRQNQPDILWDAATIKYSQPIGILNNNNQLPRAYKLEQNYPNPFNSATVINYEIPVRTNVELKIFDITGRIVKTLVNRVQMPGYYTVAFNALDIASGVYFYRIEAGSFVKTKKMVLIK